MLPVGFSFDLIWSKHLLAWPVLILERLFFVFSLFLAKQKKMFYHICFNWFYSSKMLFFVEILLILHVQYHFCTALPDGNLVCEMRAFTVVCKDKVGGLSVGRVFAFAELCNGLMTTMWWWATMIINVYHTAPPPRSRPMLTVPIQARHRATICFTYTHTPSSGV